MDNDQSLMDWSPTPATVPARGIKRQFDGEMVLASAYTPYPRGYIPGGWPKTPPESGIFASPDPSKPDSLAKRICLGLSAAASGATTSMCTIVRSMRNIRPRIPQLNLMARRTTARHAPIVAPPTPPQRQEFVAPQIPVQYSPAPVVFTARSTRRPAATKPSPQRASGPVPTTVSPQRQENVATQTPSQPTPEPYVWPKLGAPSKWPVLKPDPRFRPQTPPASPAGAESLEELFGHAVVIESDSDSGSEVSVGLDETWISPEMAQEQRVSASLSPAISSSPLVSTTPAFLIPLIAPAPQSDFSSNVPPTPSSPNATSSLPQFDISSNVPPTPLPPKTGARSLESDFSSNLPPTPLPAKTASKSPESDRSSNLPLMPALSKATFESPEFWLKSFVPRTPPSVETCRTPKSESHVERKTRAVSRRIAAAQDAKNYTLDPLPKEWEQKVDDALTNGHGSYSVHDFKKVVPTNKRDGGTAAWLNDEVINGYLKIICQHGNKDQKQGETPQYHAFSSFFMTNLLEKGVDSVKRWATRAKIGGKSLTRVEKVFIPINSGAHWTLLVVSLKTKEITYYNSLPGGGAMYVRKAVDWLQQEMGKDFVADEWNVTPNAESPQQSNSSDCGVFTITSAKQIMLGHGVMTYTAADIRTQRRRIVAELVAGRLLRNEQ